MTFSANLRLDIPKAYTTNINIGKKNLQYVNAILKYKIEDRVIKVDKLATFFNRIKSIFMRKDYFQEKVQQSIARAVGEGVRDLVYDKARHDAEKPKPEKAATSIGADRVDLSVDKYAFGSVEKKIYKKYVVSQLIEQFHDLYDKHIEEQYAEFADESAKAPTQKKALRNLSSLNHAISNINDRNRSLNVMLIKASLKEMSPPWTTDSALQTQTAEANLRNFDPTAISVLASEQTLRPTKDILQDVLHWQGTTFTTASDLAFRVIAGKTLLTARQIGMSAEKIDELKSELIKEATLTSARHLEANYQKWTQGLSLTPLKTTYDQDTGELLLARSNGQPSDLRITSNHDIEVVLLSTYELSQASDQDSLVQIVEDKGYELESARFANGRELDDTKAISINKTVQERITTVRQYLKPVGMLRDPSSLDNLTDIVKEQISHDLNQPHLNNLSKALTTAREILKLSEEKAEKLINDIYSRQDLQNLDVDQLVKTIFKEVGSKGIIRQYVLDKILDKIDNPKTSKNESLLTFLKNKSALYTQKAESVTSALLTLINQHDVDSLKDITTSNSSQGKIYRDVIKALLGEKGSESIKAQYEAEVKDFDAIVDSAQSDKQTGKAKSTKLNLLEKLKAFIPTLQKRLDNLASGTKIVSQKTFDVNRYQENADNMSKIKEELQQQKMAKAAKLASQQQSILATTSAASTADVRGTNDQAASNFTSPIASASTDNTDTSTTVTDEAAKNTAAVPPKKRGGRIVKPTEQQEATAPEVSSKQTPQKKKSPTPKSMAHKAGKVLKQTADTLTRKAKPPAASAPVRAQKTAKAAATKVSQAVKSPMDKSKSKSKLNVQDKTTKSVSTSKLNAQDKTAETKKTKPKKTTSGVTSSIPKPTVRVSKIPTAGKATKAPKKK